MDEEIPKNGYDKVQYRVFTEEVSKTRDISQRKSLLS